MSASRNRRPAADIHSDFYTAAQDRLKVNGGTTAEKAAAAAIRQSRAEEYAARQQKFFDDHLAPVLRPLLDLPAQNGRRFTAETRFSLMKPDAPALTVSLRYTGNPKGLQYHSDRAFMVMDDFVDENRFFMRLVRHDRDDPRNPKDFDTILISASVAQLHTEIGRFVADVAPDRVAELVAARDAAPGKGTPRKAGPKV